MHQTALNDKTNIQGMPQVDQLATSSFLDSKELDDEILASIEEDLLGI